MKIYQITGSDGLFFGLRKKVLSLLLLCRPKKVLTEKIDDLHKLAKALLTYETLTGEEIENLINKNVYPANKEGLKVEDDNQDSALGSIGLKPKIVH